MDCLEDNLEKLEEGCKEVVSKYVEEEDENPELSQIFVKSCESFWKANCPVGCIRCASSVVFHIIVT